MEQSDILPFKYPIYSSHHLLLLLTACGHAQYSEQYPFLISILLGYPGKSTLAKGGNPGESHSAFFFRAIHLGKVQNIQFAMSSMGRDLRVIQTTEVQYPQFLKDKMGQEPEKHFRGVLDFGKRRLHRSCIFSHNS